MPVLKHQTERFVREFANYRKKQLKERLEMVKDEPAIERARYAEAIQNDIKKIDKYVSARERSLITATEAVMYIANI